MQLKSLLLNISIGTILLTGIGLLAYQPIVNNVIAPKQLNKAYKNDLDKNDIRANRDRITKDDDLEAFDYESVETLMTMEINPSINRDNIIGGLYVPSVDILIPIMHGTTQDVLRSAIGTAKPGQVMGSGNYALLGHNSRNPDVLFAPIRRIKDGDKIYLTDKEHVYEYEYTSRQVVEPTRTDVMYDDNSMSKQEQVSLISCFADDGSDRIVVVGDLLNTYDYDDADKAIKQVFDDL